MLHVIDLHAEIDGARGEAAVDGIRIGEVGAMATGELLAKEEEHGSIELIPKEISGLGGGVSPKRDGEGRACGFAAARGGGHPREGDRRRPEGAIGLDKH